MILLCGINPARPFLRLHTCTMPTWRYLDFPKSSVLSVTTCQHKMEGSNVLILAAPARIRRGERRSSSNAALASALKDLVFAATNTPRTVVCRIFREIPLQVVTVGYWLSRIGKLHLLWARSGRPSLSLSSYGFQTVKHEDNSESVSVVFPGGDPRYVP